MTIATEIERILRETIKVDASGLAPAVVAHHITGFEEAARRIAYESAKQKEADGWRDIASAPHQEVVLLGWWDDDLMGGTIWSTETGWASQGFRNEVGSTISRHGRATHWRPLPAPPSALLSAGGEG
jgi:hypothetical protein